KWGISPRETSSTLVTHDACPIAQKPITEARAVALWQLGLTKTNHTVGAQSTCQLALKIQGMQMSQRFSHGKGQLMQVQFAPEKHGHNISSAFRCRAGLKHFGQAVGMVSVLLRNAFVHAAKWSSM